MRPASWAVPAVLAAIYAVFWIWYGGNGDPLSPQETDRLIQEMQAAARQHGVEIETELVEALRTLARQDDGREFYMLNLMRYRERALYPEGSGYDDDVAAAARRYNRTVVPALLRRGSLPILLARWQGPFLQPPGADSWDEVALVRYRSRRDTLELALELGRSGSAIHKWASIEKTQVFPVEPIFDLVFVRGAMAVLLIGLGLLAHGLLRLTRPR